MPALCFVVPVHKRFDLAGVCLRQLRRTCDALRIYGVKASAIVVGNDRNLDVARELGFGTVRRNNDFLGRKFNDGIQLACDPAYNPAPADYVMPIGSDDWVDYRIIRFPPSDMVLCYRDLSLVSPDGKELTYRKADNPGGCGLRVYPRNVLERVGYRPADEDRNRGCDTSILGNLKKFRLSYAKTDPRQIVDWKSSTNQVTPYESVAWRPSREKYDPFAALAGFYPPHSLEEMRARY